MMEFDISNTKLIGLKKIGENRYLVHVKGNGKYIGTMDRDVDGFFYYWPDEKNDGCWSANELKCISTELDFLNKEWEEKIKNDTSI